MKKSRVWSNKAFQCYLNFSSNLHIQVHLRHVPPPILDSVEAHICCLHSLGLKRALWVSLESGKRCNVGKGSDYSADSSANPKFPSLTLLFLRVRLTLI